MALPKAKRRTVGLNWCWYPSPIRFLSQMKKGAVSYDTSAHYP
jgi:hypothetical protein